MTPNLFRYLLFIVISPPCWALLYPCQHVSAEAHQQCDEGDSCHYPSFCNGLTSHCPTSVTVKDGNECLDGGGICQKGNCVKTPCKELEECVCSSVKQECNICCLSAGVCQPAFVVGLVGKDNELLSRPDGTSCDEGRGHCVRAVCYSKSAKGRSGDDDDDRVGGERVSKSSNKKKSSDSQSELREDLEVNTVLTIIALTLSIVCFVAVVMIIVFLLSTGLWLWYSPSEERVQRPRN